MRPNPLFKISFFDSRISSSLYRLLKSMLLCQLCPILALALLLSGCHRSRGDNSLPLAKKPTHQLILIDPGHGGRDLGAVNARAHVQEKDLCLKTAKIVQKKLKQIGYTTVLTRDRDEFISLNKRVTLANGHKNALFISIHFNSAQNKLAQGIEIYYCDNSDLPERWPLSKRLAESILKACIERTGAPSRGVRIGSYRVIKNTLMPSCLIECGFLTHRLEVKKLAQTRYLEKLADGIVQGIDSYCHRECLREKKPISPSNKFHTQANK